MMKKVFAFTILVFQTSFTVGKDSDVVVGPTQDNYDSCWDQGFVDDLPTAAACQRSCISKGGCNSWGYNFLRNDKRCHLCSSTEPRADISGEDHCIGNCSVWGLKEPTPTPTPTPTQTQTSTPTPTPTPPQPTTGVVGPTKDNYDSCWDLGAVDYLLTGAACQRICTLLEGCNSWGYNFLRNDKRCHLCSLTELRADISAEIHCIDTCSLWGRKEPIPTPTQVSCGDPDDFAPTCGECGGLNNCSGECKWDDVNGVCGPAWLVCGSTCVTCGPGTGVCNGNCAVDNGGCNIASNDSPSKAAAVPAPTDKPTDKPTDNPTDKEVNVSILATDTDDKESIDTDDK